eukprot:403363771
MLGEDFDTYNKIGEQGLVKQLKFINQRNENMTLIASTESGKCIIYSIQENEIINKDSAINEGLQSTRKDQPVHMWDIQSRQIVTQFKCQNQMEELITPLSIKVNPRNQTLLTGHQKGLIKLFDIEQSHEPPDTCSLRVGKSRVKQPVSSIDYSPNDINFLACGSYDSKVYLIDQRVFNKVFHTLKDFTKSGVNQVKFTSDGRYLLVSTRKQSNSIYQWDMRYPREAFVTYNYSRTLNETNQRIYFDIDENDKYLYSGNGDGNMIVYDIKQGQWVATIPSHFDSVGAVACSGKYLASGSGSRKFKQDVELSESQLDQQQLGNQDAQFKDYQKGIRLWQINQ